MKHYEVINPTDEGVRGNGSPLLTVKLVITRYSFVYGGVATAVDWSMRSLLGMNIRG